MLLQGTSRPGGAPHALWIAPSPPHSPTKARKTLMHMIAVGGGPTGFEFPAEFCDLIKGELRSWYSEPADKLKIHPRRSITKRPTRLRPGSDQVPRIDVQGAEHRGPHQDHGQEVQDNTVVFKNHKGRIEEIPSGLLMRAAGNVS